MNGRIVGTVRLWNVTAGPGRPALMLGPLAVDPSLQGLGVGSKLMREALDRAAALGHRAVLLVGDAPYYARFGFDAAAGADYATPYAGPYFMALRLAGPTCDSADVLYEKEPYLLPISLEIGDKVLIEGTGAYTTTYSAVAFNGFPPLRTHVI